jgi:hypothetical protein
MSGAKVCVRPVAYYYFPLLKLCKLCSCRVLFYWKPRVQFFMNKFIPGSSGMPDNLLSEFVQFIIIFVVRLNVFYLVGRGSLAKSHFVTLMVRTDT